MKQIIPLAFFTWVFAMTTATASGKASLRFLIERVPQGLADIAWVAGDLTGGCLKLTADQLSAPIIVPGRVIGLKSVKDNQPLATITLPEAGEAFVVLLLPEEGGILKPLVIPASDSAFRAGDVFLCNHSDKTIVGHLGTTEFELKPGQGKPVRPAAEPSVNYYDVAISVREESGDRMLRTMRWPIQMRSRSYGFFAKNPVKNRIEFRAVDELIDLSKRPGTKK
jgi:hypothetical protein